MAECEAVTSEAAAKYSLCGNPLGSPLPAETIATRRCASGAPTTNGSVSKLGHGTASAASRVGCGMSSIRAIIAPLPRHLNIAARDAQRRD